MTEDDTFRILSRPGAEEMYILYIEYVKTLDFMRTDYRAAYNKFINEHGWTAAELLEKLSVRR